MPGVTLAQSVADLTPLLVWIAVLIAIAIVGGVVLLAIRRRLFAPPPTRHESLGGLMDDLRAMHARGDLSDEEYEATRRRMVDAARSENADPESRNPP